MERKNIGTEKALQKIRHFCGYQERTHYEVKEKLYSFGLYKNDVELLLTQMIEENYLNEERFAIAFAGGKFRINNWGRMKIKFEMKKKGISDYCIKIGIQSIGEEEYEKKFQKLLQAKLLTLKAEKNIFIKKEKLQSFLRQKGYEQNLISNFIHKI